jgi:hypothetical protein
MLLELKNLLQQVVRVFEDLFHLLVSVAVFEALPAAAWADVVAPDAGKVQRLRPAKRGPHRRRWGRCRSLRGIRLRVLGRCGLLLSHRRKSYPNSGILEPAEVAK